MKNHSRVLYFALAANFVALTGQQNIEIKMHGYKKPKIDWSRKKSQRSKGDLFDSFEDTHSKKPKRNWRNAKDDDEFYDDDDEFYDGEYCKKNLKGYK